MASTVAHAHRPAKYPVSPLVQELATELHSAPSVVAQMLKPSDHRCPFTQAATIITALVAHGETCRANELCVPIDMARAPVVTVARLEDFTAAAEAMVTEWQRVVQALLWVTDAASYDTLRKRLVHLCGKTLSCISAGDMVWPG